MLGLRGPSSATTAATVAVAIGPVVVIVPWSVPSNGLRVIVLVIVVVPLRSRPLHLKQSKLRVPKKKIHTRLQKQQCNPFYGCPIPSITVIGAEENEGSESRAYLRLSMFVGEKKQKKTGAFGLLKSPLSFN